MKHEINVKMFEKSVAQEIFEATGKVVRIGGDHVWFENDELGKLEINDEYVTDDGEHGMLLEDVDGVQYEAIVGKCNDEDEVETIFVERIENDEE